MIIIENFKGKSDDEILLMISNQALCKGSTLFSFKVNHTPYAEVFIKVDGMQCLLLKTPKELAYKLIKSCVEVYAKKASIHNSRGGFDARKIYDGFMVGGVNAVDLSPFEYHVVIAPIGPSNITASFNIKPLAEHVERAKAQYAKEGMNF
jgi:hypothetical protein